MSNPSLAVPAPAQHWRGRFGSLAADLRLDASILAIFLASRILIVGAAIVAEYLVPRNAGLAAGAGPILDSLTAWDGWYYLGIARDGYHAAPVAGAYSDVAFAPLYPLLIRVVSLPFQGFEAIAAVLISNIAFLAALALLVRLGERYIGRRRAVLAASLLVIYPFASTFAMGYTESLFLLLMVATFLSAERGHRALTGILLALTVLSRLQGAALILPLLILFLRQDGWRLRPSQAWLLLGPLAAIGFFAYIAALTGSPTAFLDAQQAWGREGLGGSSPDQALGAKFSPYLGALLLTLLWAVFLLVFVRVDRLRAEYWLIPVVFIAAEMSSGSLEAVGRVTMLAFPYVWILANRRSMLARRCWPVVSVGLFTLVAVLSFAGYWVP